MSQKPHLSLASPHQHNSVASSRPASAYAFGTIGDTASGLQPSPTSAPLGESYDSSEHSRATTQNQVGRPSSGLPYNYGSSVTNTGIGGSNPLSTFSTAGWQPPQLHPSRAAHEGAYGIPVSPRASSSYPGQMNSNPSQLSSMYGVPYLPDNGVGTRQGPTTYTSNLSNANLDYSGARRTKGMTSGDYSMSRTTGPTATDTPNRLTARDEDIPYIRSSPAYQQAIACRTPRDLSMLLFAVAEGVEYANNFNNLRLNGWRASGERNLRSGFLEGASFEVFDERLGPVSIQMKGNGGPSVSNERWQPGSSKRKHASVSDTNYAHYEENSYDYKDPRRASGEMFDSHLRPTDIGADAAAWSGPRVGMASQTHLPGHSPASQRVISILDGITHEEIVARRSQGGDLVPEVAQPPSHLDGNELVDWWASKTAELIKAPSQRRAATKVTNKEYYLIWLYYMALRDAVENNANLSQTGPEADTATGRANHTHALANAVLRRSHGNYSRNDDRILKKSRKVYQLGHIIGTSPGILVMSDELSGWRLFEWFGTMEEWDNFLTRICSDSMSDWLSRIRSKLQV